MITSTFGREVSAYPDHLSVPACSVPVANRQLIVIPKIKWHCRIQQELCSVLPFRLVYDQTHESKFPCHDTGDGWLTCNVNKVHKDLQPSDTRISDDNVKHLTYSFHCFMNPFSVEEPGLYCLSSGMPAPENVQEALLSVDARGKEAFNSLVTERLVTNS